MRKRLRSGILAMTVCAIACLGVQASQHTVGHRRRKAITFLDLLRFLPFLIDNLCLNCACKSSSALSALQAQKGKSMQNGSMMRTERHGGPDVWEFRWREPGPDGKSRHRRMVVGTTNEFGDEVAARQAIAGLHLRMNARNERVKVRPITLSELVDHYRQRELKPDTLWKTHSTKVTYDGYLNKWIVPRWGNYTLNRISAGEVELWLRSLALAKSSCAKIRNIMSVLFNHGIRHEICKYNPIRLVRQGAKRKKFPTVLSGQRGSATDSYSRAARANPCLAGRG